MNEFAIENIERRNPILTSEMLEQFPLDEINQQWGLLTESIRREILNNSETRRFVASFAALPVNEQLPLDFLNELYSNSRIEKLRNRYKDKIGSYLELEAVPDEQLGVDISNSSLLENVEKKDRELQRGYGVDTDEYFEVLQRYKDTDVFLNGVTEEEKLMVAQRYRFARDVKLLALQAEVIDNIDAIESNETDTINLPSGIIINIGVEDALKREELINPVNWNKRRQIKDRIYEIEVGKSKYILKEKKTGRHVHTKKSGHKDGLSSQNEFHTANDFYEHGSLEQDNLSVRWEKPLAYVSFPDGFQFTVFEYEKDLLEETSIVNILSDEIIEHRNQLQDEYQMISELTIKYINSPKLRLYAEDKSENVVTSILEWMNLVKRKVQILSFEDFAKIKALRMERLVKGLMDESIIRRGYRNTDIANYAHKVSIKDGKPKLELFGFDFEYFIKVEQNNMDDTIGEHKKFSQDLESREGIGYLGWFDGTGVTNIQRAGYFAMLETEGIFQEKELYIV